MRLQLIVLAALVASRAAHAQDAPAEAAEPPVTGNALVGAYADSDHTTVLRAAASAGKTWDQWSLAANATVDAVTSASVDVRSSPALSAVDAVTSASGRGTSGAQMTDTRFLLTTTGGWKGDGGRTLSATSSVATENDYASISGGVNGSVDVLDRTTTLLAGVTVTDSWISSVLDSSLHHKLLAVGWSAGVARVITPADAVRVRYDGRLADGYQASPYRTVRFGNWMATNSADGQLVFVDTIGPAAGLAERLPERRTSHALVLEWVHSLAPGVGLHPSLRVGLDSWGVASVTPAIDLRIVRADWRVQLGYRFYAQTRASFYETRYTQDPSQYELYTSDKELGREIGHLGELDCAWQISDPEGPNDTRTLLFINAEVMRYSYPGFVLLPSRTGAFGVAGLRWEL